MWQMTEPTASLISFLGILLQLAGALLLGGLFFVLRVHAARRRYFLMWGSAWFALALGMLALALRYRGVPAFIGTALPDEGTAGVAALYAVYMMAKLAYYALLVAGTERYLRGTPATPFLPVALGLAAAYTVIAVYVAPDLAAIVVWQAPLAVLALGWCAVRLLRLPAPRHGVGTRIATVVTMIMALLWAVYYFAFGAIGADGVLPGGAFDVVIRYNAYLDLMLHMLLGAGMIVLLMEEAKREVDDAHRQLAVAHDELRRASLYDSVTATLNRRAFAEGVGLEAARAQFGTVMMLDLDDLKSVNDSHGHSAGDALLRHLTDSVRAELRPSDRIYRWGGDEFLLVLPGADAAGAHARLRGVISRAATLRLGADEQEVRLGVSMGSAFFVSIDELSAAIDAADARMYEDKTRKKIARASGVPAA
jgi:diguanylate cyclase (GGDEF)-like protein